MAANAENWFVKTMKDMFGDFAPFGAGAVVAVAPGIIGFRLNPIIVLGMGGAAGWATRKATDSDMNGILKGAAGGFIGDAVIVPLFL